MSYLFVPTVVLPLLSLLLGCYFIYTLKILGACMATVLIGSATYFAWISIAGVGNLKSVSVSFLLGILVSSAVYHFFMKSLPMVSNPHRLFALAVAIVTFCGGALFLFRNYQTHSQLAMSARAMKVFIVEYEHHPSFTVVPRMEIEAKENAAAFGFLGEEVSGASASAIARSSIAINFEPEIFKFYLEDKVIILEKPIPVAGVRVSVSGNLKVQVRDFDGNVLVHKEE